MLKKGTRNPRVSLLGQGQFGKVYRVDGPISMTTEHQKYSFNKGASKASSGVVPRSITYGAVAVKILKKPAGPGSNSSDAEHAEEDYYREMAILKDLGHPNVLRILLINRHTHLQSRSAKALWKMAAYRATAKSSSSTSSSPILVIELCDASLEDALHLAPPLPLWRRVEFALDFIRGLEYLHGRGIVHRDLKPANLLINGCFDDEEVFGTKNKGLPLSTSWSCRRRAKSDIVKYIGRVELADFGLAKPVDTSRSRNRRRKAGKQGPETIIMSGETGSYRFMAPENFLHKQEAKHAAAGDIFSFAMICFWLLEGIPPMMHLSGEEAIHEMAINKMRPTFRDPNSPVHKHIVPIVKACWKEDFTKRPSASEVVQMLERVVNDPESCAARPEKEKQAGEKALAKWAENPPAGALECCTLQ